MKMGFSKNGFLYYGDIEKSKRDTKWIVHSNAEMAIVASNVIVK